MQQSLSFTYDGVSSKDLGTVMINSSGGLFNETFLPSRNILEDKVNGRPKPYFKGVDIEPLSFPISLYISGWRDRNNLREIARWLFKSYYKPLIFESDPDKIYYAMFIGNSDLIHNGCKDGYITLNVRCDSPYKYSNIKTYNIQANPSGVEKTFNNDGDVLIRPSMKITMKNAGDIKIINQANGQEFIVNNLQEGEVLDVDCANETITSSEEYRGIYRYDDHNDVWLDFEECSEAKFTFIGDFDVEFKLEYAYLAEDNPIFFDR